jgi:hypothetical protein
MTSEAPNHTPPAFSHETQRLAHSCPYDTLSYGTNHPPIAKQSEVASLMAQICSNEQKRRRFSEREQVYTTIWIVPNSHTWQYYVLMNFRTCPPETCKHSKFDCILPQYGYASQLSTPKNCIAWFIIFLQTHATNWRMTPFWDKIHTNSVQHPKCRPFILPRQ